jgi:hypothetical protein
MCVCVRKTLNLINQPVTKEILVLLQLLLDLFHIVATRMDRPWWDYNRIQFPFYTVKTIINRRFLSFLFYFYQQAGAFV